MSNTRGAAVFRIFFGRASLAKDTRGLRVHVPEGTAVTLTDDELMARGAGGDDDAFRLLVERWEGMVFAFLLHMLGSREEAEDLSQETFVRMIGAAHRYRPEGRFRSWLLQIAGNRARNYLRRRKIIRWLPFDLLRTDPPDGSRSALAELEIDEERAAVRAAIGRLPVRQRQALVLRHYQELSYEEIALAMGVTCGSVQMLLHRAMLALRGSLGGWKEEL
jgi:RNA polymerase sigma-70 factor (ECF subfamily)